LKLGKIMDNRLIYFFQIRKEIRNQGKFTGFKDLFNSKSCRWNILFLIKEVSNSQLKDLVEFADEK
jgi:hypothetical protein